MQQQHQQSLHEQQAPRMPLTGATVNDNPIRTQPMTLTAGSSNINISLNGAIPATTLVHTRLPYPALLPSINFAHSMASAPHPPPSHPPPPFHPYFHPVNSSSSTTTPPPSFNFTSTPILPRIPSTSSLASTVGSSPSPRLSIGSNSSNSSNGSSNGSLHGNSSVSGASSSSSSVSPARLSGLTLHPSASSGSLAAVGSGASNVSVSPEVEAQIIPLPPTLLTDENNDASAMIISPHQMSKEQQHLVEVDGAVTSTSGKSASLVANSQDECGELTSIQCSPTTAAAAAGLGLMQDASMTSPRFDGNTGALNYSSSGNNNYLAAMDALTAVSRLMLQPKSPKGTQQHQPRHQQPSSSQRINKQSRASMHMRVASKDDLVVPSPSARLPRKMQPAVAESSSLPTSPTRSRSSSLSTSSSSSSSFHRTHSKRLNARRSSFVAESRTTKLPPSAKKYNESTYMSQSTFLSYFRRSSSLSEAVTRITKDYPTYKSVSVYARARRMGCAFEAGRFVNRTQRGKGNRHDEDDEDEEEEEDDDNEAEEEQNGSSDESVSEDDGGVNARSSENENENENDAAIILDGVDENDVGLRC